MNQPNPDLLAEYGTDEVLLANLEKVADDTRFGPSLGYMSRSEWARLRAARVQSRVDRQRAQAAAINMQFRQLESQAMANTIENFGGAGTRRSAYVRAMQAQPYNVHPLLLAGGMSPMMMGGEMAGPEIMGGMGMPMGAGVDREVLASPEGMMPGGPDAVMGGLEREMAVHASAHPGYTEAGEKLAMAMGRDMARVLSGSVKEAAVDPNAYEFGQGMGQVAQGLGAMSMGAGRGIGEASLNLGGRAIRALKVPGNIVGSAARGFSNWMNQDVQPTPNWGMGFTPARDVNQYGQPIY